MNNNWKQKLKKSMKRGLAGFVGAAVLATSFPLPDPAFAQVNYEDLTKDKATIINKAPVTPVKLENGQATDLIQNPAQPAIYTLRTDYKVQKGEEWKIKYQPYVASVGAAATEEEKEKVDKLIDLPELNGYVKPEENYRVTYAGVVEKARTGKKTGVEYLGKQEFLYSPQEKAIKVKHVFQDLYDFNKYNKRASEKQIKYTEQTGNTGSMLEVQPLPNSEIPGFVPEASHLLTLVPEDTENFEVEYRYNRKTFEVDFDTNGGTPIATRRLYYEQTIPPVQEPTKVGSDFVGWIPSVNVQDRSGKVYHAGDRMVNSAGNPITDLNADIVMPASDVKFTAEWKDKPKAEYVIQFWTEKPDYDDKDDALPLRDRYDFIGARRVDDADTGSKPDLTDLDIHGITFPDLNDGRLEKAQNSKEEFERYYFLNEELTKKQNASEDNPEVQKSVLSTGETVYNVYYDRRVYTLYFTSINDYNDPWAYWPIITKGGQVLGKEGDPYKVSVRFNQSLDKIWPKDEEVSGLPKGDTSEPTGDDGLIGWTINNNVPFLIFRDTPPYRLSAEDFIDPEDVLGTGEDQGHGHADKIPIGKNKEKDRGEYEISLGASYIDTAIAYHIDIIKDDFEGKEQIDYDMSYWKSDTNTYDYEFILPHLQGFTLKKETRPAQLIGKIKVGDVEKTFDELNAERNKKTPFRSDDDKIEYISHFPWSQKLFDGTNAYDYANYTRNKYKLKLNNDPKTVKNDSEYGAGDILEVPYELPLKDLELDTKHVPARPDWVPADWSFLGWALDPAGDNLVEDGNETKLHYDQVLYAKWGEPNRTWTVTVDPAEGKMKTLNSKDIVKKKATVDGKQYPVKEDNQGANQIFTVSHKQQLKELPKPTRQGYDFLGWEWVRHNEDGSVDNSYRDTYHVPELYPFGNDVVGDVYLKAIWVENNRVNLVAYHHFIGDDGMELKDALKEVPIVNIRAGQYTSASGFYQNEDWILASSEELINSPDDGVKEQYKEYNDRVHFNNTDFHTFRVEPAKILDENGEMVENPNAKNNVFHFYYRHFKTRNYKVNYLDERAQAEMEKAETPEAKKEIVEKYSIIPQENVVSKNRHFDARNYRPIPGWKLVSEPQQQLFYDVDEKTGEFKGINGTGSDEITFYYKDVRVIEVPKDGKTPKGYVRVTFKADKGGSFKDKDGNSVTELHYDVIKGLKSDLLPVPKLLEEGETADPNKHYITPDDGKTFTKWDEKPLLNDNTIIENETPGYYVFTAQFEWSGVSAKGLVTTEAFNDPANKWTNNFSPTVDKLKSQVVWREKDVETALPADATVKIVDEKDQTKELTDADVYEKVKEMGTPDKDELVRTVNFKAIVTFKDGRNTKELDIPVKVYKNVYEGLTGTAKPLFLSEAEGKPAAQGGLQDVTGEYVKVTVAPTGDLKAKDNKVYYVNPKAWVEIPKVNTDDSTKFLNWTADKDAQNENGIYDFTKRHKFTEDTVISPAFANDVVEQKDPDKKPDVPSTYVKVIVKTTDKATDDTAFEKTFWVNPTTEVAITVPVPDGKENQKVTLEGLGDKEVTYIFKEWQKVKAGATDDNLTEVKPAEKIDLAKNKFTDKVTVIEAAYKKSIQAEEIVDPLKTTKLDTPEGKEITDQDLIDKITPQEGKEIESIKVISKPDGNTVGNEPAKVIVKYKDGSTQGTNDNPVVIPVEVHKNIIPAEPGGKKPEGALDNYVKVTFKAGTGGTVSGALVYYVSPEVEVDMTESADKVTKTPGVGYTANGGTWSPEIKAEKITEEKTYEFNFVKSGDIIEKIDENTKKPDGYVTVIFRAADNGKLEGNVKEKIYYVNPKAEIKLVELTGDQTAGAKQLAVPKTIPDNNYGFKEWVESIDKTHSITGDREHVAHFTKGEVTLTYDAGGAEGTLPETVSAKQGATVQLANAAGLTKQNAIFAGWKLDGDDKLYQPGASITLDRNRTATAQWTTDKHVIPQEEGQDKPSNVPDNYVQVTFNPTEKGVLTGTRIFWVDPDVEVTIPVNDPQGKQYFTFNGWKIDDEAYNPQTAKQFKEKTTVKATYKEADNIIPYDPNEPITKPDGYVRVTFAADPGLKLTEQKAYYVKQNAKDAAGEPLTLKAIKDDTTNYGYPTYSEDTGYKFEKWDKEDTLKIETTNIVVTAKATKPGNNTGGSSGGSIVVPSTPKPTPEKPSEGDLNKDDHYQYLIGYPDGTFAPNRGMTRAEVATMFTRLLKDRPVKGQTYAAGLSDIYAGDWYANTVGYAVQKGIVSGYPDGTFKPNQPITRAEFSSIASRFAALTEEKDLTFSDLDASHWGYKAIRLAASNGWISGYPDNTFRPEKAITRAEVTSITNRMLNRYADLDWIDAHRAEVIRFSDVGRSDWFFEPVMEATMGHDFTRNADGKTEHWTGLNGKTFI